MLLHEEAELRADITKQYERYIEAPQDRHPIDHARYPLRGQLIDVTAQTFEQRMNRALDSYLDLARFSAQAVLLETPGSV